MFKNNKGFISIELIVIGGSIMMLGLLGMFMYDVMIPHKGMTNTMQYEGLILEKYHENQGKSGTYYYVVVEGLNGKEIKFNIQRENYDALEPGYHIKYFSYQYKDEQTTHYELGTVKSKGTIILVTSSNQTNQPNSK